MKLYFLPGAPSPNRVRLYIAEKNSTSNIIKIDEINLTGGKQKEPAHLARNTLGKVPVLEIAENSYIHESLAIVEYLEELFPEPSMFGTTPLERAKTRATERVAEIRVFYPLARYVQAMVTQRSRFPDPAIATHFKSQFPIGLSYLNQQVKAAGPFLTGKNVTMADCTLAAILEFARVHEIIVLNEYEALSAWFQRYRERATAQRIFMLPDVLA